MEITEEDFSFDDIQSKAKELYKGLRDNNIIAAYKRNDNINNLMKNWVSTKSQEENIKRSFVANTSIKASQIFNLINELKRTEVTHKNTTTGYSITKGISSLPIKVAIVEKLLVVSNNTYHYDIRASNLTNISKDFQNFRANKENKLLNDNNFYGIFSGSFVDDKDLSSEVDKIIDSDSNTKWYDATRKVLYWEFMKWFDIHTPPAEQRSSLTEPEEDLISNVIIKILKFDFGDIRKITSPYSDMNRSNIQLYRKLLTRVMPFMPNAMFIWVPPTLWETFTHLFMSPRLLTRIESISELTLMLKTQPKQGVEEEEEEEDDDLTVRNILFESLLSSQKKRNIIAGELSFDEDGFNEDTSDFPSMIKTINMLRNIIIDTVIPIEKFTKKIETGIRRVTTEIISKRLLELFTNIGKSDLNRADVDIDDIINEYIEAQGTKSKVQSTIRKIQKFISIYDTDSIGNAGAQEISIENMKRILSELVMDIDIIDKTEDIIKNKKANFRFLENQSIIIVLKNRKYFQPPTPDVKKSKKINEDYEQIREINRMLSVEFNGTVKIYILKDTEKILKEDEKDKKQPIVHKGFITSITNILSNSLQYIKELSGGTVKEIKEDIENSNVVLITKPKYSYTSINTFTTILPLNQESFNIIHDDKNKCFCLNIQSMVLIIIKSWQI